MTRYTKELVAVMLFHARNERVLEEAKREAASPSYLAYLGRRVDFPYRTWETEPMRVRDFWGHEVDRLSAVLERAEKLGFQSADIPASAGLCGVQP